MSAYVVALIRIEDREQYAGYERRFMAVLAPFAGEVLAVDDAPRALEGAWPGPRTVLLKFPDEGAARRWHESPAYQEIARDRLAASSGSIALIAGLTVMLTKEKAGAFVLRARTGGPHELLLFTHVDYPDAPIQIPGGGIEPGESPEAAVRRELQEEAGVSGLPLLRKLGVSEFPWQDTLLRRHCYVFDGTSLPEHWVHTVSGQGEDKHLRFAYRWHAIAADFRLCGDLSHFLKPEFLPELYPAPPP